MCLYVLENEVVKPSIVNLAGFGKTSGTRCIDAAHLVYREQNNNYLVFARKVQADTHSYSGGLPSNDLLGGGGGGCGEDNFSFSSSDLACGRDDSPRTE